MDSVEIIKLISIIAIPTATAFCAYYFNKKADREAELRKEKLEHYKIFSQCLSRIIENESTNESQIDFAHAAGQLNLVGSEEVIDELNKYMNIIDKPVSERGSEYKKTQSNLFRKIRKDLLLKDKDPSLEFFLWPSGVSQISSPNNTIQPTANASTD